MTNKMNKKRTKAATAGALMLAIMLTVSACGAGQDKPAQNGNGTTEAGVNDQLPEENGVQEPGSIGSGETPRSEETATTEGEAVTEEPADLIISNEGIYTGQIDPNSIEIKSDQGADSYQITEELAPVIEALPTDAAVTFEYTEKVIDSEQGIKQRWLTKIETKS
ncbi:hypothetical protein RB620_12880 [Paenibacillus sp. LHD-117]|uniref:hypothetical protein n=1 Tax=Paenibacillus sp. LHD-117 TaxID=3071412 RepID=UPI0027DF6F7A|nr:hypothetical protein [Paenibacillus sp. LHD-117]MDQ6420331.1 hypothetical protein [Paenibacillus sp. LHD-117]